MSTWWTPPDPDERVVLLIRHGQTAWNAERRFLGATDLHLDEVGRSQAEALRPLASRVSGLWVSPLRRARQTAEAFGDAHNVHEALAELNQGELEGLRGDEAMARFPDFFRAWAADPGTACPPGGQRLDERRDQAWAVLQEVIAAQLPVAAVVSHQLVLSALAATVAGQPLSAWRDFALPNGGGAVLIVGRGGLRVAWRRLTGAELTGDRPPAV